MSKVTIVETHKQNVGIRVTPSLDVGITNIGMEIVGVLSMDVIRKGVLIRFATKLDSRIGWNLDSKEFESKFGTTNNNYWSYWDTSDGVY